MRLILWAFLGVPFDLGVTKARGTLFAPKKLREFSQRYPYKLSPETKLPAGWYDVDREYALLKNITLGDAGDTWLLPGESFKQIFTRISKAVKKIVSKPSFPVIIGGDHSITFPIVKSFSDAPMGIIWIDAHSDFDKLIKNVENNHSNVLRKISQLPFITDITWIGARGLFARQEYDDREEFQKLKVITPGNFRKQGPSEIVDKIEEDKRYYVSIDIDVLDPTWAPGTGAPLAGGLTDEELFALLMALGSKRNIIGFDLVEINPMMDVSNKTVLTAIKLILYFLDAIFKRKTSTS